MTETQYSQLHFLVKSAVFLVSRFGTLDDWLEDGVEEWPHCIKISSHLVQGVSTYKVSTTLRP